MTFKIKSLRKIIGNTIFIAIIASGFLFTYFYISGKNVFRIYIVTSGSMEPAVKTGSIVISVPYQKYVQGDIISFKQDKNIITHRLMVKFFPEGANSSPVYKTAGDANKSFDPWEVRDEEIVGKSVLSLPYLGYIANYAKTPYGFMLFVIVPATIVIYEEFKNLLREMRKFLSTLISKLFFRLRCPTLQVELRSKEKGGVPKISILLPVFGTLFVLAGLASSFFVDTEKALGNVLGSATWDIMPSVTPIPSGKIAGLYLSNPYTCPAGATDTTASFGTVTILVENNTVKVDVAITGADPGASYDIWINQDPGGCPLSSPSFPAGILTDGSGNGSGHFELAEVSGATNFWISAVDINQVLRSTAVSF